MEGPQHDRCRKTAAVRTERRPSGRSNERAAIRLEQSVRDAGKATCPPGRKTGRARMESMRRLTPERSISADPQPTEGPEAQTTCRRGDGAFNLFGPLFLAGAFRSEPRGRSPWRDVDGRVRADVVTRRSRRAAVAPPSISSAFHPSTHAAASLRLFDHRQPRPKLSDELATTAALVAPLERGKVAKTRSDRPKIDRPVAFARALGRFWSVWWPTSEAFPIACDDQPLRWRAARPRWLAR